MKALLFAAIVLFSVAQATIHFHEAFDDLKRWIHSEKKDDYGKAVLSSGDFTGDAKISHGLKTSQDAKFYAISAEFPKAITNEGKDLVVSFSVKHEQGLDCGGGYLKFLPEMDPTQFHGDSEYFLMFGPDQCGYNKRVHAIFNYKGENLLWKKEPKYPDDKLTHVYTLRVTPENKYEMYIDQELKESGSLEEDWKFLKPKMIDDPSDKKPSDWVDNAQIDDPTDKKPEDWNNEPETVADPEAKKPDDWDDAEDGAWEAPQIPNPKSKGTWRPKRIPNPAYKGEWKPKQIENPDFVHDDKLHLIRKPLKHVGLDVWQVKSGSIFDNIIIGDNLAEVNAIVDNTWKAIKDAEKKAEEDKKKTEEKKDEEAKKDEDEKEDL
jgi:calreticulin